MAKEQRQENLIDGLRAFEAERGDESPYEMHDAVEFLVDRGIWEPPGYGALLSDWKKNCAAELSEAARKEHHRDASGRRVRSFYSTKVIREEEGKKQQKALWSSRDIASWEFKVSGIGDRYSQIVGDKISLQNDVDSLNEFDRPKGKPAIQLHWDFRNVGTDEAAGEAS